MIQDMTQFLTLLASTVHKNNVKHTKLPQVKVLHSLMCDLQSIKPITINK